MKPGGFDEQACCREQLFFPQSGVELIAMSSQEELTFVVGRWLWPFIVVLYVGRRLGFWPIPSREQRSTALNQ